MHLRLRHLNNIIEKKARILPIVGVLGPHQVGKSTLLRDLLAGPKDIPYFTPDRPEVLREVRATPEAFVLHHAEKFKIPCAFEHLHHFDRP